MSAGAPLQLCDGKGGEEKKKEKKKKPMNRCVNQAVGGIVVQFWLLVIYYVF